MRGGRYFNAGGDSRDPFTPRPRGLARSTVKRIEAFEAQLGVANAEIATLITANTTLTFALGSAHARLAGVDTAPRPPRSDCALVAEIAELRATLAAERARLAAYDRRPPPDLGRPRPAPTPDRGADHDFMAVLRQRDAALLELTSLRRLIPTLPQPGIDPAGSPPASPAKRSTAIPSTRDLLDLLQVHATAAAANGPSSAPVSPLAHRSPSPAPAPLPAPRHPVLVFQVPAPSVTNDPGSPPTSPQLSPDAASDSGSGSRRRRRSPAQPFGSLSPRPLGHTEPRTASPPANQSPTPSPPRTSHHGQPCRRLPPH